MEGADADQLPESMILLDRRYFYKHSGIEDRQLAIGWLNKRMHCRLIVRSSSIHFYELMAAVRENSGGNYAVIPLGSLYYLWFEHEDDAVAFKLGYDQLLVPVYVTQKHV